MSPSNSYPAQILSRDVLETLAAKSGLLSRLGARAVEQVWPYLERAVFEPGAVVAREGAENLELSFVVSGEARLSRGGAEVGRIGAGNHFGELGLFAGRYNSATVDAASTLEVATLTRERYEQMSQREPALALVLTQALIGSLGHELSEKTSSVAESSKSRRREFVDVTVSREWHRVRTGTAFGELLPRDIAGDPVVAALVNKKAVALGMPITSEAHVEPLCASHWEGKRVYRSSLGLLLLEAARRVDRDSLVRLGPSKGVGQSIELAPKGAVKAAEWVLSVTAMMRKLIAADLPFKQELWTVEEARSHLAVAQDARDVLPLLRTSRTGHVQLVSAGETTMYSMTPLLPSAGLIERFPFRLSVEDDGGIFLHYGDEGRIEPVGGAALIPSRLSEVMKADNARLGVRGEVAHWLATLGMTSVGAFNEACILGKTPEIIRVSEGQHEKQIGRIADVIADRRKIRAICVTGPSSSGKTTFIKRLTVQLLVNGVRSVGLSFDDYYRDRELTVRDAEGDYDYEALEALDVDLLRSDLKRIFEGERVKTARYDFLNGKSVPGGGPEITLRGSDVLVLEGIHGLNPRLIGDLLERENIFRIFLEPITSLPFDRMNRVNVSDVRLIRRIVRDRHTRGAPAAANILRWPKVRAGERAHIFPFLEQADIIFNSALVYELGVIKVFADRYLLEVPHEHPAFVTAHRLRQLIDKFVTIYPDHVPQTSILREFIGGSGFDV